MCHLETIRGDLGLTEKLIAKKIIYFVIFFRKEAPKGRAFGSSESIEEKTGTR